MEGDPYQGDWSGLQCGGSPDIKPMLEKAVLMISSPEARQVSWKLFEELVPVSASVESGPDRLWGYFRVGEVEYYYEIVSRRTPPTFKEMRSLYGVVCKVIAHQGPGGELGHPGTWVAEESGKVYVG